MVGSSTYINLELFKSRSHTYTCLDYAGDFKGFWKWKTGTETGDEHILDENHRDETYNRLCDILPGWLTYRPYDSSACLEILENSLRNIVNAYGQIRHYSLLDFDKIPIKPLELIWHELGRAKEGNGERNATGLYYIVAITKPLMFLWGQTLAFDSLVRDFIPRSLRVPKGHTWIFDDWRKAMKNIQEFLMQQPEAIELFKETSRENYGTDSLIPYGQFVDLYYWVEGKEHVL